MNGPSMTLVNLRLLQCIQLASLRLQPAQAHLLCCSARSIACLLFGSSFGLFSLPPSPQCPTWECGLERKSQSIQMQRERPPANHRPTGTRDRGDTRRACCTSRLNPQMQRRCSGERYHQGELHCPDDAQRITRSGTAAGTALPRTPIRRAPNPDRWQRCRHGTSSSTDTDVTVQP